METKGKTLYLKNEKGEFVCPHCGETKARQNTMFYHIKRHEGVKKYACSDCDKTFVQKSGLDQHRLQAHTKEGDAPIWACPCCDHTSRVKSNLLIHIGRKHGEGWITPVAGAGACACEGCKRDFASATAYFYHAVQCFTPPDTIAEALAAL
jgi:KRAB domain-containing zinc finger protein